MSSTAETPTFSPSLFTIDMLRACIEETPKEGLSAMSQGEIDTINHLLDQWLDEFILKKLSATRTSFIVNRLPPTLDLDISQQILAERGFDIECNPVNLATTVLNTIRSAFTGRDYNTYTVTVAVEIESNSNVTDKSDATPSDDACNGKS